MEENQKPGKKEKEPQAPKAPQEPAKAQPAAAAPSPQKPPAEETEAARPAFARILAWSPWFLAALAFGFLLCLFLLYLPARTSLNHTQSQLADVQSQLTQTSSDLENTQNNLQTAQANLDAAQFDLALANLENNVTYARLALATRDLLTARQEMSAASDNLDKFIPLLNDPEMASALKERVDTIRTTLTTDSTSALDQLRALSENLQRIERK